MNPPDIENFSRKRIEQVAWHNGLLTDRWAEFEVPRTLKPMWKKLRSLGETDKRGRSNLGDLIRRGKVSEKQLRDYLREYFRLMALKQNGGLPRELLEFFKKNGQMDGRYG